MMCIYYLLLEEYYENKSKDRRAKSGELSRLDTRAQAHEPTDLTQPLRRIFRYVSSLSSVFGWQMTVRWSFARSMRNGPHPPINFGKGLTLYPSPLMTVRLKEGRVHSLKWKWKSTKKKISINNVMLLLDCPPPQCIADGGRRPSGFSSSKMEFRRISCRRILDSSIDELIECTKVPRVRWYVRIIV